jgi:hypothetical protein
MLESLSEIEESGLLNYHSNCHIDKILTTLLIPSKKCTMSLKTLDQVDNPRSGNLNVHLRSLKNARENGRSWDPGIPNLYFVT